LTTLGFSIYLEKTDGVAGRDGETQTIVVVTMTQGVMYYPAYWAKRRIP